MNISVIGTGYVGLVSGTCFAETGNKVTCVDIDSHKVERMQNGFVPIYEPGLEMLFERNSRQGRLKFTTDLVSAVKSSDIIFLALPTPPGADGSADLSFVLKVADQISHIIEKYTVIVDKSTVPVGTAEKVEAILSKNLPLDMFDVVANPEFLREGAAIDDFLKPDRVVVGTTSQRAIEKMQLLYGPFVRQGNPIIFMDQRSAEMTKYAANAYLATRISFMNEIANLCEEVGANVDYVRKGMGSDGRIGKRFLFPGVGYGGSCFPKDVKALSRTAHQASYDFKILDAVMGVNEIQKMRMVQKLKAYFNDDLRGRKIAIWGLAFKPNTDDIREAPALTIIQELLTMQAQVSVFDPEAMKNAKAEFSDEVSFGEDQYDVLDQADALCIVTEWSVFRTPDFDQMKKMMKAPVIFDGRNLYDLKPMRESGFYYNSIGREIIG